MKLDELKDGPWRKWQGIGTMEKDCKCYKAQQIFLTEYDGLIEEGQNCDWPHVDMNWSNRTLTEHGNYIVLKEPRGPEDGGYWCITPDIVASVAKMLAYDAFNAFKILWKEGKLIAVKGKPGLRIYSERNYAWYAQIYG